MILHVMAIYDSKARAYLQPFYVSHPDIGLRSFQTLANMPEHMCCEHPTDFTIVKLGTFNDESAVFELLPNPLHLATASQLKRGIADVQH